MECLSSDVILKFQPDTLEAVRKIYGLDPPEAMKEAVDILDDWVKKQNHFVKKDFKRDYLERTIITTKGSVERAKARLDKGATLRTLMPDYFKDFDVKKDFANLNGEVYHAVLPQMTKDYNRIFIIKSVAKLMNYSMFFNCYKLYNMFGEYLRIHDYPNGLIVIWDMEEANLMETIKFTNPLDLRQAIIFLTEGYGLRLSSIHILTSSKIVDTLVSILKQVLSDKIGGRIYVHKTVESLCEVMPRDLLPADYGGKEISMTELNDKWLNILSSEEFRKYWREMSRACTDESLRLKDSFNDQYLGMPGTFRTLSVD